MSDLVARRNPRLLLFAILALLQWAWLLKGVPQLKGGDFGIFYRSAASATPYVADPLNPKTSTGEPLPNLNPPHFLLVIKPLTWLSLPVAAAVWWTVSLTLLLSGLTWWLHDQGQRWTAEHVVWMLLWMPVLTVAFTGQVTAIVGVPLWLAYRNLRDGRDWRGGLWAGVVLSIKPILWPLGAWYLVRRAWPVLGGMIAGGCAMVALGTAVYGFDLYRTWLTTLAGISWGPEIMNTSLRGILARLPLQIPPMLWMAAVIGVVAWTVWRTRRWDVSDSWFPLMAASLLASPLGWIHYGAWLLPGTRITFWTRGIARGWCVPVLVVAGLSNVNPLLWATVGSWYGWTLLALWWRSLAPAPVASVGGVAGVAVDQHLIPADMAQPAPAVSAYSRILRAGLAAATGLAIGLIASQLHTAWAHAQTNDFSAFYDSARAWIGGKDLYLTSAIFPNLNPPHFIVAFGALGYLPLRAALVSWLVINFVCGIVAIRILFSTLEIPCTIVNAQLALIACGLCIGVLVAIEAGQLTGLLMLLMTLAWSASRRGRWLACGLLVGLIVGIKPFFGCLFLVPLLHRQFTALVAAVGSIVVALVASVLFAGPHSLLRWIETGQLITWFNHPANASFLGLLARAGVQSWAWWCVLSLLAIVVSVSLIAKVADLDTKWAVCALLSILISPLGWDYYLPVAAAPLVAIALRHRSVAFAAIGFMWPIPLVVAIVPATQWGMIWAGSLQTISLVLIWIAVLATSTSSAASRDAIAQTI